MSEQVYKNDQPRDELLERVQTASYVSIPHIFEQLYLGPRNNTDGKLRRMLGNPTPIGETFISSIRFPSEAQKQQR
ncbi:hypothetical protein PHISCL_02934 [Aspergillus sclerotialis]|uniref:Uncharacterized protein n=1 Tax=Aspergillus sclerotialis TaxID=2070753 RepID=A0A3A3A3W3_9EURO|nr:hypothetical protein PHISCL_02934 [Aspergillus sclerotialis]